MQSLLAQQKARGENNKTPKFSCSRHVLDLDGEGLQIFVISSIGGDRLPDDLGGLVAILFAPLGVLFLDGGCFLHSKRLHISA